MPLALPPADVLLANFLAVPAVWGWVVLAGLPLASLPRVPLGFAAVPLFGLAYWGAVLYLVPFGGGLEVAMGAALVGGIGTLVVRWRRIPPAVRRAWRTLPPYLLLAFVVSLHSVCALNLTPIGMDASMHATSARLIAEHHSLPRTHAPLAPTLPFPAVNLGVPAAAAAAVRCGCSPEAATLATVPLSYAAFAFGVFVLARRWVRPVGAAAVAVLGVTASRGLQETICWGGYPTVAGFGVALLAARAGWDAVRRPSIGSGVAAGVAAAGVPLVHGISGAVGVYAVAPLVLLAAVPHFRHWRRWWKAALAAALTAGGLLAAYFPFAPTVDGTARDWTREFQRQFAPAGEGFALVKSSAEVCVRWAGTEPVLAWLTGIVWLFARGRWRPAALLTLGGLLVCAVVLNAAVWVLPGSVALYPERACYLLNATGSLALAAGWRALPPWSRRRKWAWAAIWLALTAASVPKYFDRYQKTAVAAGLPPAARTYPVSTASADEYAALRWCRDHLDPAAAMVDARYGGAGAYLPAVAGVAATGWHVHSFILPQQRELFAARPPTHHFMVIAHGGPMIGEVLYQNAAVVIVRVPDGGK